MTLQLGATKACQSYSWSQEPIEVLTLSIEHNIYHHRVSSNCTSNLILYNTKSQLYVGSWISELQNLHFPIRLTLRRVHCNNNLSGEPLFSPYNS